MITTTNEIENVTWPTTWAVVPRWIKLNGTSDSCVNTTSSDTAITISGVTSGTSISELAAPEPRPRQRARPSASSTPSGVAIAMSSAASSTLWISASVYAELWKTDWIGSPHHQRVENPCQTLRERPALNENRIAIATGTSAHTMYSHV